MPSSEILSGGPTDQVLARRNSGPGFRAIFRCGVQASVRAAAVPSSRPRPEVGRPAPVLLVTLHGCTGRENRALPWGGPSPPETGRVTSIPNAIGEGMGEVINAYI